MGNDKVWTWKSLKNVFVNVEYQNELLLPIMFCIVCLYVFLGMDELRDLEASFTQT